jgi:hypothetical protein
MKKYKIEHKIFTLADCAVMEKETTPASFEIEGIQFSHWDFNYRDGWLAADAWLSTAEVEAEGVFDAINNFRAKLSKLIPRISLISQSYITFVLEPFIAHDLSSDIVFFEYIEDVKGGGLMFMENEREALVLLLKRTEIPESFFSYWNDAVNASGYSAKLLLMFSAIEALAKKERKKDWDLINSILGEDLAKELFEKENGLRHRLVHGEYFDGRDDSKNYLERIHQKVVRYFNTAIFSKSLISEDVVRPQRHPFGNKRSGQWFIKRKDGASSFSLKDMLDDFGSNGFRTPARYEYVSGSELAKTY